MRLIGVGLPRTATLSQKVALEMLGLGPCYHMVNVLAQLEDVTRWRDAINDPDTLTEILDGFGSTVDWPGAFFYEELVDLYPEARFLLSVRDGESWAKSMLETVWGVFFGENLIHHMSAARAIVDPGWRSFVEMMTELWEGSGLLEDVQAGSVELLAAGMERFNRQVIASVPSERLLVWNVTDGWEPLCSFLDLPVPTTAFPRENDTAVFNQRIIAGSIAAVQAHTGVLAP